MASAGLLTLGVFGVETSHCQAQSQIGAGGDKPWNLAATLRGFYDDNINTSPNKQYSYGFEIRPSGALNLSLDDQTTLGATAMYSMKYFDARQSEKADHMVDLGLNFNHNFSERYTVAASDHFVIGQEPEVLTGSGTPLRANGDNIYNAGKLSGTAEITPLLSFVLSYGNNIYSFKQDGPGEYGPELNRIEHMVTLDSRWSVFEQTVFVFGYQFEDIVHTSDTSLNPAGFVYINPDVRDSRSHFVYAGVDHKFSEDLSASVRGGAQITDYNNDPNSNTSVGPYVNLSATYNYTSDGSATLGFTQQRTQTDESGVILPTGNVINANLSNLSIDQDSSTVYGSLTQKLFTPDLTGSLIGSFQNSNYRQGDLANATDKWYSIGLNLAYQFTPFLSAEVGYNYDKLDSGVPGLTYDRNRIYIGFTGSY